VIVAEWVVFIHTFIARGAGDCRQLRGHFVGIPPGVLLEKITERKGKNGYEYKPQPAPAAFDGGSQETGADHGDNRHPTPGKLHETHLGQKVPHGCGQTKHHERGQRTQQE
jgi:hypothetical protein